MIFPFLCPWFYFISFQLQLGGWTFRKGLKHADRFWEGCQLLADRNVDVYLFTLTLIFFCLKWNSSWLDSMVMIKIEFVITIFWLRLFWHDMFTFCLWFFWKQFWNSAICITYLSIPMTWRGWENVFPWVTLVQKDAIFFESKKWGWNSTKDANQ